MPPKVTAGLARSRVSGYKRSPAPPASKTPRVSLILMVSDYKFPPWGVRILACWRADGAPWWRVPAHRRSRMLAHPTPGETRQAGRPAARLLLLIDPDAKGL